MRSAAKGATGGPGGEPSSCSYFTNAILIPIAISVMPNTLCSTASEIPEANFAPTILPSHIWPRFAANSRYSRNRASL